MDIKTTLFELLFKLWQYDSLLAVAMVLTLLCLAWALLDNTGLFFGWIPKRKTLAEALQSPVITTLGVSHVDVGDELVPRLLRIVTDRDRTGRGIALAQQCLARFYDPLPFVPNAFAKALTYAVVYTLLFWLLPWLVGGSCKLGQSALLPENLGVVHRLGILLPLLPLVLYGWSKQHFVLSESREDFGFLLALALLLAAVAAVTVTVTVTVTVAVAVAVAVTVVAFAGAGAVAGAVAVAVAVAVAGVAAFAGGVAGVAAFAFAVAFAVAFAFAFAVAVAGAGAGAGAFAVAAAGAFAVAAAGAFVVTVTAAGTFAVAAAFVIYFITDNGFKKATARTFDYSSWWVRLNACTVPAAVMSIWLLLVASMPLWLDSLLPTKPDWMAAENPSFAVLFFLGWLPLLNALFDFVSVGLTQYFLARMQQGRWNVWWWLADALSALLLVFGLYWLVIGLLYAMQALGWGIDPRAILEQFLTDPFSVMWLLLLTLTNILPTLLHWSLGLAGLWSDRLGGKAEFARQWAQKTLAGEALGKVDAENFADYLLFGYRWFSLALSLCLLTWMVWAFHWLLPHSLRWLL